MKRFLSVREFAEKYGVSKTWVNDQISRGLIKTVHFKGTELRPRRIDESVIAQLFTESSAPEPSNVVSIARARSVTTKEISEFTSHESSNPVRKEDLWT